MKTRIALAALSGIVLPACNISSGILGEHGTVRFSFVGRSPEAEDNAPVATNSTLRVLLQHPQDHKIVTVDGTTFADLTLKVRTTSGPSPQAVPLGIAEYAVFFPSAGQYELVAMKGQAELDTASIEAKHPDSIKFTETATVSTSAEKCSGVARVPLRNLTLANNQSATLNLVPWAGLTALHGLPELVLTTTNAKTDTVASSYAISDLNFNIQAERSGDSFSVRATDVLNNLSTNTTIATTATSAPCSN